MPQIVAVTSSASPIRMRLGSLFVHFGKISDIYNRVIATQSGFPGSHLTERILRNGDYAYFTCLIFLIPHGGKLEKLLSAPGAFLNGAFPLAQGLSSGFTQVSVFLINQISFAAGCFSSTSHPKKIKLVPARDRNQQSVEDALSRSPAKVGCIYRKVRLSVNPNFASIEKLMSSIQLSQQRFGLFDPGLVPLLLKGGAVSFIRQEIGQFLPGGILIASLSV